MKDCLTDTSRQRSYPYLTGLYPILADEKNDDNIFSSAYARPAKTLTNT